jgi:hypothetical protein
VRRFNRRNAPNAERPYKTFGYHFLPGLYHYLTAICIAVDMSTSSGWEFWNYANWYSKVFGKTKGSFFFEYMNYNFGWLKSNF